MWIWTWFDNALRFLIFGSLLAGRSYQLRGQLNMASVIISNEKVMSPDQQELPKSGLDFRAIFDNARDAMLIANDAAEYVDVNPAACSLFGMSRRDIIGRRVAELGPARSRREIEKRWAAFLEAGEQTGEFRLFPKDGSPVEVEYHAKASVLPNFHLSILRDITKRKRAEQALAHVRQQLNAVTQANAVLKDETAKLKQVEAALITSENQFLVAQRIAHLGSWERDLSTSTIKASEEFCRIFFGFVPPKSLITYEALFNLIHPEDRPLLQRATEEFLENPKPFSLEYRVRHRDGTVRVVHVRAEVVCDATGKPIKVYGIAQDITDQKHAEQEREKQKEILEKIFAHIPVMISFFDAGGQLKLINRELERTQGWSLKELEDNQIDMLVEAYPEAEYRKEVLQFIAAANGEWRDFKARARDGRLIDATWAVVRLSDGTSFCIGRDISEQKRAEEERSRLLRRLITAQEDERQNIARELHDNIGQYLATLVMALESLTKVPRLPPRAKDQLHYLKDVTRQFDHDVHRFALESRPPALDDLGLEAALSALVRDWAARYQKIRVDLKIDSFGDPIERLSSQVEVAIYRVVQAALTNVSRHSNAESVSIILERNARSVRVIIDDDGDGFDVEKVTSMPVENRRLGLISMRERVELVGGEFKIDSGAGTTIVVTIPLSHLTNGRSEV
jgi:PAS domain S-box-containing protein